MIDKKELRKKLKRANSRLDTLRKKGYGNISAIPLALKQMEIATGEKQKKYFKMGRNKTEQDLEKIEAQADRFLNSNWSTIRGIKAIVTKSAATLQENSNLTDEQLANVIDTFQLDVYNKAMELGGLSSKQIVNLAKDGNNYSSKDFEKSLTEYVNKLAEQDIAEQDRFQLFLNILDGNKK